MTTIYCEDTDCGFRVDIELDSETNPRRCPKCGGVLLIDGLGLPLYREDWEYNNMTEWED